MDEIEPTFKSHEHLQNALEKLSVQSKIKTAADRRTPMKFLETYYCEYLLCLHGKQKGTRNKTFYNNRRGRGRTTATKIKPAPQNSLVIFFKCINNKNRRTAKKKLGGIFSSDCLLSLKTVVAHRMRCSRSEKLNKILLVFICGSFSNPLGLNVG